jgi:hypothetical protein
VIDMAKAEPTSFRARKLDMELECTGFSAEEILDFLAALGGGEAVKEPKIDMDMIRKLSEERGDLHEFVDSGDNKDIEVINLERDLKVVKLPNCTSNFTCPHCRQSILLENDGKTLVRDYRNHKLYDIGELKLPNMKVNPADALSETDNSLLLAVYKDCIELIDRTKEFVLVSGSTESCSCPVCGTDGAVGEFIKYHEMNYNDGETCDICGCEKDNVITQTGDGTISSFDCVNHCIEKLNKLYEE